MPPTRMALAAQGSSAGLTGSCCGDEPADRKAADAQTGRPGQHQACNDPICNISTGSSTSTLEFLSIAERDGQQHAQAPSSTIASSSHSPEHPEDTPPGSHAVSHQQDVGRPANQPRHGVPADTQHGGAQSSAAGQQMESRYVHGVYDIIAGHFSATRFAIWPKVNRSHRAFISACWEGRQPLMACFSGDERSPSMGMTCR